MGMNQRNLSSSFGTSPYPNFELERLKSDHPVLKSDHLALSSDLNYAKSEVKTSRYIMFVLSSAKSDLVPAKFDQNVAKSKF